MPSPTPVVTDVNGLFSGAYALMVAVRAENNYPPMQPAALVSFQIGGEYGPQDQIAPRIVITPTTGEYDFSQVMSSLQTPSLNAQVPRKQRYRRWLHFEAAIWGDPDPAVLVPPTDPPTVISPYFDFNSVLELEREFIDAMYLKATGGAFVPLGGEWVQKSANNRFGRLYVLHFKIATAVMSEPYVVLPYSQTTGDGGVSRVITPAFVNVEGGQTDLPPIDVP
jgi:hypothetical protein